MPQTSALSIVDLNRYPISDMDSPAVATIVADVRAQLAKNGCVVLPNFISEDGLELLAGEAARLSPLAFFSQAKVNCYGRQPETDFPVGHPRNHMLIRKNGFVAGDNIAADTYARGLYHHEAFKRFLAACISSPAVYEFADPLAQIVVNVVKPGDKHTWHFDSNDFVVTIMTQAPDEGGDFDFVPNIRNPGDENYPAVQAVLDGDVSGVSSLELRPGDLQFFFGRYSLHRVRQTSGTRDRHTVVLAYSREPGILGKAEKTSNIFGRKLSSHDTEENTRVRSDQLVD
jgi:hypothetical protein